MGRRITGRESLERYLKQATYGLWGRRRKEVMEELEGHILERVMAHRLGGRSEEEAMARALAELGKPAAVRAGMLRLHVMPRVLAFGALAVCALSALLFALGGRTEVLAVSYRWPSADCLSALERALPQVCWSAASPWLEVARLKEVLEEQGVTVQPRGNGLELGFPGARGVWASQRQFWRQPDGVAHRGSPDGGYIDAWSLLQSIATQSGLMVRLEGWTNPRVRVGEITFVIGTPGAPVDGYLWYGRKLQEMLVLDVEALRGPALTVRSASREDGSDHLHRLNVTAAPGTVYAVVMRVEAAPDEEAFRDSTLALHLDLAPVSAEGTVALRLPAEEVVFVNNWWELRSGSGGEALLLKLSGELTTGEGRLAYRVVAP